jgi:hypothetical protein
MGEVGEPHGYVFFCGMSMYSRGKDKCVSGLTAVRQSLVRIISA